MQLPPTCDCFILGGGVVGLSLAFELAGRGERVVVVDKQTPGREASWAGAGILPPGSWYNDHPSSIELAAHSTRLNPSWAAELRQLTGIDNEYRVCGGVYVASSASHAVELERKFALWNSLDIEWQPASGAELRRLVAGISDELYERANEFGTYYVPGEAQLRNPLHLQALAAGCQRRGAAVCYPIAVQLVEQRSDQTFTITTNEGVCSAARIAIAAGAWSGQVAQLIKLKLPSKPVRGQMVLFHSSAEAEQRNLHLGARYLVPRLDGRLIAGTTVEEVGFDKTTTPEAIDDLVGWARRLLPRLNDARVEKTWAGLRPASGDELPYLGGVPGVHNAYVATGFYRSGLQFAAAAAVSLAESMHGGTPPIDLHPLRVDR